MTKCDSDLRYDFYSHRTLVVRFSDLELSSDPGVRIILRADAGFALPEILSLCERSGGGYAIGYARNAVINRPRLGLISGLLQE